MSINRNNWTQILATAVKAAAVIMFVWLTFEYIWPSRASWREVCDRGYTHYTYVPVQNCTNGTCTTKIETRSQYICLESHWTCRKGRDGSTKCSTPAPGRTW